MSDEEEGVENEVLTTEPEGLNVEGIPNEDQGEPGNEEPEGFIRDNLDYRPRTRSQTRAPSRPSLEGLTPRERRNLQWDLKSVHWADPVSSDEPMTPQSNELEQPSSPRSERMDREDEQVSIASTLFDEFVL